MDQAAKLLATEAGPEEIEAMILSETCASTAVKQPVQIAHRLNRKNAIVLADRVTKAEAKPKRKISSRQNRYCKWCKVSCRSGKNLFDNDVSAEPERIFENLEIKLRCNICYREFWLAADLANHILSDKNNNVARAILEEIKYLPISAFLYH